MLYVDHFSDEHLENARSLSTANIEDAFKFYEPCLKEVELKTEEGDIVFEDFKFMHLSDFDDDQLIAASETLRTLYENMNNSEDAKQCLIENLCVIHEKAMAFEIAYRTLSLFWAHNRDSYTIHLLNVNKDELGCYNSRDTNAVLSKLRYYCAYILVIPGYLGDVSTVRMWAKSVYSHGVIMITDYKDCFDYEKTLYELENAPLQDEDDYLANVVMTCNYIAAETSPSFLGEKREIFLPGSAAFAGLVTDVIYNGCRRHGKAMSILDNRSLFIKDFRINLSESQANRLADKGVVPFLRRGDYAEIASSRTLYNGENAILREFPLLLVASYIEKCAQSALSNEANHCDRSRLEKETEYLNYHQSQLWFSLCRFMSKEQFIICDYKIIHISLLDSLDPSDKEKGVVVIKVVFIGGQSALLEIGQNKTNLYSLSRSCGT